MAFDHKIWKKTSLKVAKIQKRSLKYCKNEPGSRIPKRLKLRNFENENGPIAITKCIMCWLI